MKDPLPPPPALKFASVPPPPPPPSGSTHQFITSRFVNDDRLQNALTTPPGYPQPPPPTQRSEGTTTRDLPNPSIVLPSGAMAQLPMRAPPAYSVAEVMQLRRDFQNSPMVPPKPTASTVDEKIQTIPPATAGDQHRDDNVKTKKVEETKKKKNSDSVKKPSSPSSDDADRQRAAKDPVSSSESDDEEAKSPKKPTTAVDSTKKSSKRSEDADRKKASKDSASSSESDDEEAKSPKKPTTAVDSKKKPSKRSDDADRQRAAKDPVSSSESDDEEAKSPQKPTTAVDSTKKSSKRSEDADRKRASKDSASSSESDDKEAKSPKKPTTAVDSMKKSSKRSEDANRRPSTTTTSSSSSASDTTAKIDSEEKKSKKKEAPPASSTSTDAKATKKESKKPKDSAKVSTKKKPTASSSEASSEAEEEEKAGPRSSSAKPKWKSGSSEDDDESASPKKSKSKLQKSSEAKTTEPASDDSDSEAAAAKESKSGGKKQQPVLPSIQVNGKEDGDKKVSKVSQQSSTSKSSADDDHKKNASESDEEDGDNKDSNKLAVGGMKKGGGDSTRNLSKSYKEHHMHIEQLTEAFPKSNINAEKPTKCGGMSDADAKQKLEKDGPNALEKQKKVSNFKLFFRQLFNMFNILLMCAAALSLITWFINRSQMLNLYSACVLIVIVVVMSVVTFLEERKAIRVVEGFTELLPVKCDVVRDGKRRSIKADDIVVGDIVIIKRETRVPADVRLLYVKGLKLETSSITGEAEPIECTEEAAASHKDVFDANNVAFNGSFCVDGSGSGVVIRTGKHTIIGQIADLTNTQGEEKTTLEVEINRFVRFIALSSVVMGLIIFVVGGFMTHWKDVLNTFITGFLVIIIANVPQGLPATVSSQLTIIARRLAKKNVFVKRLGVVDAFGAATVIASDKTGTLTQNNMTVTDLWVDKKFLKGVPKAKHSSANETKKHSHGIEDFPSPVSEMLEVMAVCNEAKMERERGMRGKKGKKSMSKEDSEANSMDRVCGIDLWRPSGAGADKKKDDKPSGLPDVEAGNKKKDDPKKPQLPNRQEQSTIHHKHISGAPSEVALLRYVDSVTSSAAIRKKYKVMEDGDDGDKQKKKKAGSSGDGECEYIAMVKGAPEIVLKKCSRIAIGKKTEKIDKGVDEEFHHAYEQFGNSGRRVLGCAMKRFTEKADADFSKDGNAKYPDSHMTFLGIAALMDPPRPDAAEAITTCKNAGIKVFMVTGDHPTTATAIAKEIGLIGEAESMGHGSKRHHVKLSLAEDEDQKYAVVHGQILSTMKEEDWDELLEHRFIVFARTTPELKLLIVEQCQQRGEIVCVTGDGVNDAPALKKADIGVAMGIAGNDVAKQAADIVLMDDNFASIVRGIEEGRLLFDNLRKTIAYTLTHSMPEVVPICFNFIFGLPMSLSTLQILSIDLGTEMGPAISLAYEKPEADIMSKPPRKRTTRLVSYAMLLYSYVLAGGMIIIGSMLAYLFVYWHHKIAIKDLFYSAIDHFQLTGSKNFTSNGVTYNHAQQLQIRQEAAAAYYLTLVMCQVYHLWMCRTRRSSIFKHGFFTNGMAIVAVIVELLLVNFFTFTPGVQYIMGASNPPWQVWIFSLVVGVCLWVFNETRKYFIRHWPLHPVVRIFKW